MTTKEELEQENLKLRNELAAAKAELQQVQRQALLAVITASTLQLRALDEQIGKTA